MSFNVRLFPSPLGGIVEIFQKDRQKWQKEVLSGSACKNNVICQTSIAMIVIYVEYIVLQIKTKIYVFFSPDNLHSKVVFLWWLYFLLYHLKIQITWYIKNISNKLKSADTIFFIIFSLWIFWSLKILSTSINLNVTSRVENLLMNLFL